MHRQIKLRHIVEVIRHHRYRNRRLDGRIEQGYRTGQTAAGEGGRMRSSRRSRSAGQVGLPNEALVHRIHRSVRFTVERRREFLHLRDGAFHPEKSYASTYL